MTAPITLIEIIAPSEQGMSRPYLCRGEDDALYYVKGRQTDRHSLWAEWICGHLAKAFGLPIPPVCLVEVLPELLEEAPASLRNLGAGIAFASQKQPGASWFEPSWARRVSRELQQDILVFDWWIRNQDRLHTNTNLLWDEQLWVIDHNRAFDDQFDAQNFLEHHVFAANVPTIFDDLAAQALYADRLSALLPVFDEACDNAPQEWQWANIEQDVPANFSILTARAMLSECVNPDFWRMV